MNWARQARARTRPAGTSPVRGRRREAVTGSSPRREEERALTTGLGQHDRPGRYSTGPDSLTIRAADLGGPRPVDIEIAAGTVRRLTDVGLGGAGPVLDAGGGAVLPGLHD